MLHEDNRSRRPRGQADIDRSGLAQDNGGSRVLLDQTDRYDRAVSSAVSPRGWQDSEVSELSSARETAPRGWQDSEVSELGSARAGLRLVKSGQAGRQSQAAAEPLISKLPAGHGAGHGHYQEHQSHPHERTRLTSLDGGIDEIVGSCGRFEAELMRTHWARSQDVRIRRHTNQPSPIALPDEIAYSPGSVASSWDLQTPHTTVSETRSLEVLSPGGYPSRLTQRAANNEQWHTGRHSQSGFRLVVPHRHKFRRHAPGASSAATRRWVASAVEEAGDLLLHHDTTRGATSHGRRKDRRQPLRIQLPHEEAEALSTDRSGASRRQVISPGGSEALSPALSSVSLGGTVDTVPVWRGNRVTPTTSVDVATPTRRPVTAPNMAMANKPRRSTWRQRETRSSAMTKSDVDLNSRFYG